MDVATVVVEAGNEASRSALLVDVREVLEQAVIRKIRAKSNGSKRFMIRPPCIGEIT